MAIRLIERELGAEHLPPNAFGSLEAATFVVGRTCSRSVLGTMNDMRYQIDAAVHQSAGLRHIDLPDLNRWLRRIPFSAIKYDRPIDRTRAILEGATGATTVALATPQGHPSDRIDELFGDFLAERRQGLSTRVFRNYEAIIEFFRLHLNGYAYESLPPFDRRRWDRALNSGDEDAYCKLFGADRIPAEVGLLLATS